MGRVLYLDCYTGISCTKILTALLKLGIDERKLTQELKKLIFQKEETDCFITLRQAEIIIQEAGLKNHIKEQLIWILESTAEILAHCEENKEKIISLAKGEDSLLKLVSVLEAMDILDFSEFILSPVTEGLGVHEEKSVPDAAIMRMIEKYRIPVRFVSGEGEKITLLGAGIAACLMSEEKLPSTVYVERIGFGDGIRAMILNTQNCGDCMSKTQEKQDVVQVLETNVDDCSGEQLGYAIECLMKAGALDASCFPIYMKKQRPAYMLQVICKKEKQEQLEDVIFRETTSIGLRRYEEKRRILPRTFREVRLKDGHKVKIKICEHHGQNFYYPEYETVKQVCEKTGRPYRNVYDEAAALAGGFYDDL